MKALVTGVAGFIGSHLAEKIIEQGGTVYGIDSFTDYYPRTVKEMNLECLRKNNSFAFIEGSIEHMLLKPLIHQVDYVFHLAAQAGVRASWDKYFYRYTTNNINALQHLLEECKESNLKKFVFASSSSVYGETKELPMKENAELSPVSPYGLTKVVGEKLCALYCKTYQVPVISLRYFTVFGPRQRPDMAFHKFMHSMYYSLPIKIYGDGTQTRDFTFVDDVVQATIHSVLHGKTGEIYNIGGGNRNKLIDVIDMIFKIAQRKTDLIFIETQKGDVKDTYAHIEKAIQDIYYSPSVSLLQGLTQQWNWFLHTVKNKTATNSCNE